MKNYTDLSKYPVLMDLLESSPLKWEVDLEGQRVVDGQVILGMKAGPSYDVTNLCHEVCHYVESPLDRCNKQGWGIKYPKIYQESFSTPKHLEREGRVWAWQYVLHDMVGLDTKDIVSSSPYLPDLWLLKDAYGIPDTKNTTIIAFFKDYTASLGYTQEEFLRRFHERNEYIKTFSPLIPEMSCKDRGTSL